MQERESIAAEQTAPDTWLSPTEALNRFDPPAGAMFEAEGKAQEWARYGFRIGTLNLLIGWTTGSEVMPMTSLSPVPNTPPWLKGILNLRGNLVPVFDLKLAIGIDEPSQAEKPMVLILDKADSAVGMIVDGLPRALLNLRKLQRLPQLPSKLDGCTPSGYLKEEELWLEFDHKEFFTRLVNA